MAQSTPASFLHTLRFLCATLMSSQIFLLAAAAAALGEKGVHAPPVWAVAVVLVLGAVEAAVISAIGYRVPAIAPGTSEDDTRRTVVRSVQSSTIARFALAEAVAIAALVLAFVADEGGSVVALVGVVISLVLCGLHVWPSQRVLGRFKDGFEREGGQSRLDAVMDAPPSRG